MMGKIKGAMIYPVFVFCGLGAVGVMTIMFVVPKLTDILTQSGAELPFTTKLLIGTSNFLTSYWWLALMMLAGLIIGFKLILANEKGRRIFDMISLKVPVFGLLLQKIYVVRFCRSFQTLLVGGVSMSHSLEIAAQVVSNTIYRDLILETKKEVEDGNSLSTAFMSSPYIPPMVAQMVSIGEKTGRLDMVLLKISEFYSREINNIVANLMSLMEPLIMVIMGVAVGLMVAAVIMPMYNMASNF
jgi:type IV pilus assembly protein PilC